MRAWEAMSSALVGEEEIPPALPPGEGWGECAFAFLLEAVLPIPRLGRREGPLPRRRRIGPRPPVGPSKSEGVPHGGRACRSQAGQLIQDSAGARAACRLPDS